MRARKLASLEIPGGARRVAAVGELAYVAADFPGIHIIDWANSEAPRLLNTFATLGAVTDLAVSGSHAFLANQERGLEVVSLADPRNPVLVVQTLATKATAIAASHGFVYLCGSRGLDITDPIALWITEVTLSASEAAGFFRLNQ